MKRILLIEDDVGAQLLYRNRLTDLGYQVVVSATGAMGLMEARSAPFDLFLVDIGLGTGIDGYEVCRRLKAIPEIHGVPVVLISGLVRAQEDLHRGYEVGCQSFLVKGDLMLLEDVVRAMLRIKSLQDDLAMQNRLLEERNRRSQVEKSPGAELDPSGSLGRDARLNRPDGVLLVDGEGLVCTGDRGARDLFGQETEGRHLALLAPDSRLEAIVRNARTEAGTSIRFEVSERAGRSARALFASVYPLRPQPDGAGTALRIVILFDATRQRHAAEGPCGDEELALRQRALLVEAAREVFRPAALLGSSATIRELRARVARAANTDQPVLVRGPSGSGKGFVARCLHFSGARPGPFVAVACGGSDVRELELELFGGGKGAQEPGERSGAFQLTSGGTLFLQDVERLPGRLQERVLETLVQRQVRRQDSTTVERVDVRLVAGTRIDLERAALQGEFSPKLARRLAAETLVLTALQDRAQDIDALAQHFLARYSRFEDARFSVDAAWVLGQYAWPDNVRELERTVQCACEAAQTSEIQLADLPQPFLDLHRAQPRRSSGAAPVQLRLHSSADAKVSLLDAYEKGALLHALSLTSGDKLAAARLLEVGKSTFYRKLKLHGIA